MLLLHEFHSKKFLLPDKLSSKVMSHPLMRALIRFCAFFGIEFLLIGCSFV